MSEGMKYSRLLDREKVSFKSEIVKDFSKVYVFLLFSLLLDQLDVFGRFISKIRAVYIHKSNYIYAIQKSFIVSTNYSVSYSKHLILLLLMIIPLI